MKKYALIGRNLTYSHSKIIHEFLIDKFKVNATYDLIEKEYITKELLETYDGLNITIPFKEDIPQFLKTNSSKICSCNTVHNKNGLHGYNTDFDGFDLLVKKLNLENIDTIIILGNGASAKMVAKYFETKKIIIISRKDQKYNYETLQNYTADILINTTPIGMNSFESPIEEKYINNFKAIIDLNYNPTNSKLSLLAKSNDIPFINGLYMLIKQASSSFEIWHHVRINDEIIEQIYQKILFKTHKNIALIGMPLSGKTTFIGRYNGVDLDKEIIRNTKKSIEELIQNNTFRIEETKTLQSLVDKNTPLIALGGGAILKKENMKLLKKYLIIFFDVDLEILKKRSQSAKRPLIKNDTDLETIYHERINIYRKYANITMNPNKIKEKFDEINDH